MRAKALAVFRTKLKRDDKETLLVEVGQEFEGDVDHLRALARNGLVVVLDNDGEGEVEGATAGESFAGNGEKVQMPDTPKPKATKPKTAKAKAGKE